MLKRRNLKVLAAAIGVSVMSGLYASPVWAANVSNGETYGNVTIGTVAFDANDDSNFAGQTVTGVFGGAMETDNMSIKNSLTIGSIRLTNENFAALATAGSDISGLRTDVDWLSAKVENNANNINWVSERVTTNANNINWVSERVTTNANNIDWINGRLTTVEDNTGGITRNDNKTATTIEGKMSVGNDGQVVIGTESGKQVVIKDGNVSGENASFNGKVAADEVAVNKGIAAAGGKFTVDGETGETIVSDGQGKTTTIGAGSLGVKGATGSFNVKDQSGNTMVYTNSTQNETTFMLDASTGNIATKGSANLADGTFVVNGNGLATYSGTDKVNETFGVNAQTGDVSMVGGLEVGTNAVVNGQVAANKVVVNTDIIAGGAVNAQSANINGQLAAGSAVINKDVTVGEDLQVNGNATFNGYTHHKGGAFFGEDNTADSYTAIQDGGFRLQDEGTAVLMDKEGIVVTGENADVSIGSDDESERIYLSNLGQIDDVDDELQGRMTKQTAVNAISTEAQIRREEVARLDNRIDKVEDRLDKVGAMTAAIANLRTMGYDPCAPSEFSMSLGHYRGETGMALGFFHYPNRDFMLSFSVSTAGDEYMGGIGATWKFGRKTPEQLAEEIKAKEAKKALAKAEAERKAVVAAKVRVQQAKHAEMQ